MFAVIDGAVIPGVSKPQLIERGKVMVVEGKSRREAAVAIYDQYFSKDKVQPSTYHRRLNYLVRKLA